MNMLERKIERTQKHNNAIKAIESSSHDVTLKVLSSLKSIIETDEDLQNLILAKLDNISKVNLFCTSVHYKGNIIDQIAESISFELFNKIVTSLISEDDPLYGFMFESLYMAKYVNMCMEIQRGLFKNWFIFCENIEDIYRFSLRLHDEQIDTLFNNYIKILTADKIPAISAQFENITCAKEKLDTITEAFETAYRLLPFNVTKNKIFKEFLKCYTDEWKQLYEYHIDNNTDPDLRIRLKKVLEFC